MTYKVIAIVCNINTIYRVYNDTNCKFAIFSGLEQRALTNIIFLENQQNPVPKKCKIVNIHLYLFTTSHAINNAVGLVTYFRRQAGTGDSGKICRLINVNMTSNME